MARSETAKAVEEMQGREYDARVKEFLAEKAVLAQILKGCVEEFRNCSTEDIENKYIEGVPSVNTTRVGRDETNVVPLSEGSKIQGGNSEDKTDTEGTVFYDIRFVALSPNGDGFIRLIINVEAQKDANPGYSLVRRGIYYCSRLISAQKETEFNGSDYDNIRKVYSIWICYNATKDKNTIVRYAMKPEKVVGDAAEDVKNYDLLQVVMIQLGDPDQVDRGSLLRFLGTVFSEKLRLQTKLDTLEDEYGIRKDKVEKEMERMCNISEGIFERGMAKGMAQGVVQGMAQGMRQGMAQGMAQGMQKGRAEGRKQGEDRQARQTALNLHALGMDVSFIAKATGYPEETVSGWVMKN